MSTITASQEQKVVDEVPKQLYIGGEWRDGAKGTLSVEDPSTEEALCDVADASVGDARGAPQQLVALMHSGRLEGRRVLDGAFSILDALADADEGLGLTALARSSGLAKSSAHRLAEQLVTLGAVERLNHRYFVGARMMRLGQRWQPDPVLRRCAQRPIHALAVQSRAMASLRILHENRLHYICAAVPHGHAYMPDHPDPESIARTATGRVLYAAQPTGTVALPDCWTRSEWRALRDSLADPRVTVIDHGEAVPGICCVSAPVRWPSGACAGAVTVSVHANHPPVGLSTLLSRMASRIGADLRRQEARSLGEKRHGDGSMR